MQRLAYLPRNGTHSLFSGRCSMSRSAARCRRFSSSVTPLVSPAFGGGSCCCRCWASGVLYPLAACNRHDCNCPDAEKVGSPPMTRPVCNGVHHPVTRLCCISFTSAIGFAAAGRATLGETEATVS